MFPSVDCVFEMFHLLSILSELGSDILSELGKTEKVTVGGAFRRDRLGHGTGPGFSGAPCP